MKNQLNHKITPIGSSLLEAVSEENGQFVKLEVQRIIGRSAFRKRNNLFIDLKDNIISVSGCNLIIMSPDRRKQQPTNQPCQYIQ